MHPPSDEVPTQLGRYTILRRPDGAPWQLGRGGMGATYKAFDAGLERVVVLKLIDGALLAQPQMRARFQREARLTAQLSHPHIGTVYDVGSENGVEFFVMEFIDGENAQYLLRRDGPFAWPWVLRAAAQVGGALEAAWARGIIHRDITPANLMVVRGPERDPARPFIKVIDFGLARLRESFEHDSEKISTVGEFMGTYHYASPEQCEGLELDCRTDIYSLGATLWFLLCGQTLFRGSRQQVLTGHLCRPPIPADLDGQPAAVVDLLCRMLAKVPADRPAGPQELLEAIGRTAASLASGSVRTEVEVGRPASASPVVAAAEVYRLLQAGGEWAGSYHLIEELKVLPGRRRFRAASLSAPSGRTVCLEIIDPRVWADTAARRHLHATASVVSSVVQPGLWPCAGVRADPATGLHYLERASVPGVTLFDRLRQRSGALTRQEVRLLLEPLPATLDALVRLKTAPPDLPPGSLLLDDSGGKTVQFDVFDSLFEAEVATLAPGGLTGPGVARPSSDSTNDALVPAFARLIYELCGGAPVALDRAGFRPLVALDEAGNQFLRRALDGGYPDCQTFWNDLHTIRAQPGPVAATIHVSVSANPEPPAASTVPDAETAEWSNSLGMRFRRVPGTGVDFGVWPTRVRDYAAFAAKEEASGQAWQRPGFLQAGDHPVTGVNLAQAEAFCRWLSKTEGRIYRLPTDQEWSVAVGLSGTGRERGQGNVFPWDGGWPPPARVGNYGTARGGSQRTTPVGSFDANALGLYDLGGNVWEWCTDPVDKVGAAFGVLRGGSWNTASRAMGLSAARHLAPKDRSTNSFGFRVVAVVRG